LIKYKEESLRMMEWSYFSLTNLNLFNKFFKCENLQTTGEIFNSSCADETYFLIITIILKVLCNGRIAKVTGALMRSILSLENFSTNLKTTGSEILHKMKQCRPEHL